ILRVLSSRNLCALCASVVQSRNKSEIRNLKSEIQRMKIELWFEENSVARSMAQVCVFACRARRIGVVLLGDNDPDLVLARERIEDIVRHMTVHFCTNNTEPA